MSRIGSTQVSFRTVAILVVLLAGVLLGPAPIKAALPVDQGDVYIFPPTAVAAGQDVQLVFHNFTKGTIKVRFLLLDAKGHDLFAANQIDGTMMVAPGTMGMGVVPGVGIVGPDMTRVEVTGLVAWVPPADPARPQTPFKPRGFVGPASLQLVDAKTQQTLGGGIGPIDLVGAVVPLDDVASVVPID